jgi:hypothetical protein
MRIAAFRPRQKRCRTEGCRAGSGLQRPAVTFDACRFDCDHAQRSNLRDGEVDEDDAALQYLAPEQHVCRTDHQARRKRRAQQRPVKAQVHQLFFPFSPPSNRSIVTW